MVRAFNRPIVAIIAVTALAAFVRFFHVGHPGELVFDEVYYPKAGCLLLGEPDEVCMIDSDDEGYWVRQQWDVGSWVHPPLGKWQIALGIKAFGMDPFGWRFSSALAGTLVVTGTALIAQLLFRRAVWTYAAGLLMSLEHLNVVLSRTALLDVHLEFWVVAGFLFLLLDRRWLDRHGPPEVPPEVDPFDDDPLEAAPLPPVFSPVWRPWRFATGAAFGAATAVKWSGAMPLVAAILLTYGWETSRRHRGELSWRGAFWRAFARESFGMALAFVVVPIAVFVLAWVPWLHHFDWDLAKWWRTQRDTLRYHRDGLPWTRLDPETDVSTPTHPYYARPWTWLPMVRPTSFFVEDQGPGIQQILAIGHPAIFWASTVALPYLAIAWRRLHDWRAGFILVAFLVQYVPWFFVSRPTFFFYALPLTPFIVVSVIYLMRGLSDATIVVRDDSGTVATNPETGRPAVSTAYVYRPFVWIYVIVVVAVFVWFWPVLTAGSISDVHWRAIVWFNRWI